MLVKYLFLSGLNGIVTLILDAQNVHISYLFVRFDANQFNELILNEGKKEKHFLFQGQYETLTHQLKKEKTFIL